MIADLEDTSLEKIDQFLNVNVKGMLYKLKNVCPGTVDTPIARRAVEHAANISGRSAEEVYQLFSGKIAYMTGSLVSIHGGITAQ